METVKLTVPALVSQHARDGNTKTAIFYRDQALSFAELDLQARRLARSFSELGVQSGDRVGVWLPNVPAWHVCLLACARLGATVVALNTRFRSAELTQILGKSEPKILILWPDFRGIDFVPILQDCDRPALASIKTYVCYSEAGADAVRILDTPTYAWHELLAKAELDRDDSDPQCGGVVFTTSGTTSAPKLALHTQRSISQHALDTVQGFGYGEPGATILVVTPMCGTSGLGMAVAALAAGRPQVISPISRPDETAVFIRRYQVTHVHFTYQILSQVLALPENDSTFRSLRLVNCGTGAPLLVESAARRGISVVGVYGSSEVQARFSRQNERLPFNERALGGGTPVSGDAVVRVRCLTSGRLLPPDEDGELEIKAPSQFAHYFGDAEISLRATTSDHFYRTGDLGHMLTDGRHIFVSRIGDALRLSGFLVSPAHIEQVIQQHPTVNLCQVVGTGTTGNVRPIAFVQIKPGQVFDEKILTEYCRQKMAPYKIPSAFLRLDEFPVKEGPNQNKIQKAQLREMADALLANKTSPAD